MTINPNDPGDTDAAEPDETSRTPEQEHPVQDAHGGSMAPGLVDDTGNPVAPQPPTAAGE